MRKCIIFGISFLVLLLNLNVECWRSKWAIFGKQNWRCGMNRTSKLRCLSFSLIRPHKRCWLIKTAGRWPWKSESAKECVTTYLPNQLALKMDGAGAKHLYFTVSLHELFEIWVYLKFWFCCLWCTEKRDVVFCTLTKNSVNNIN